MPDTTVPADLLTHDRVLPLSTSRGQSANVCILDLLGGMLNAIRIAIFVYPFTSFIMNPLLAGAYISAANAVSSPRKFRVSQETRRLLEECSVFLGYDHCFRVVHLAARVWDIELHFETEVVFVQTFASVTEHVRLRVSDSVGTLCSRFFGFVPNQATLVIIERANSQRLVELDGQTSIISIVPILPGDRIYIFFPFLA